MTAAATLADDHLAAWSTTDPAVRRDPIERAFAADADDLDPQMAGQGTDGSDTMIGAIQEQLPGFRLTLVEGPDAHDDRVRFSWLLAPEGGDPIALGIDFATITPTVACRPSRDSSRPSRRSNDHAGVARRSPRRL